MPEDKSQVETLTLNETSTGTLNETTLPQQPGLIGQTVDQRYVIESAIGQGGVGAVYLARDRKLHDKRVVLKILLDRSLQNEWVVQKFQQEKEALARVDHPGVVGILDTGELPDGKAYLVMQFIDGVTLRSQVRPEGMPLARAAEIIKQIGRALSAAHERGIFHRDLKPENIMLQSFGRGEEQVKIIDFGIAKLKDSLVAPSTVTGATAGTVAYMAPEQLAGKSISAATDIFALGAIAYEIVTGRKPFNPETGFELLEMQRSGVRVQPRDLRPAISTEANEVILRALNFAPADRFQTARDFGEVLAQSLDDESGTLDQNSASPVPATQLATSANPLARQTGDLSSKTIAGRYEPARVDTLQQPSLIASVTDEAEPSRRRTFGGIALALFLVIGAAAGVLIWKREAIFGGRERSLGYSLTVQKMRDGKPFQTEFESSGQEIFENGWKFRLNVDSRQDGYLYLLNEGPASANSSTYNVLFPESKTNSGSPQVTAGRKLQTDWMRFDEQQGTEKFWIIWSAAPVKELEAVTEVVNDQDLGEIKDAVKAKAVRDFLNQQATPKPEVTKDSAKKQSVIKGKGDVLVNAIELEHH
jgi:serine/threonine protein kinase